MRCFFEEGTGEPVLNSCVGGINITRSRVTSAFRKGVTFILTKSIFHIAKCHRIIFLQWKFGKCVHIFRFARPSSVI